MAIICSAIVTTEVHYGAGRHYESLDAVGKLQAVKLNWISQPFTIFSCGVGKISIAFLLLRIMAKNKYREWFLYVLITLLVAINAICVAFIFAQCSPTRKLWEQSISGSCLKPYIQQDVGFFQASFSSFSDLVLALFPLIIIWKLQMRRAVKLGLGCAMSLGLLATGAAIVKTIQLQDLTARGDYTYQTVDLVIWFTTEMYTVIVAACVPTLRPLLPLLYGQSPSRKSISGRRETYQSARDRNKKGYRVHEDDDAHHLQIISPPRSYGNPNLSRDSHLETPNAEMMRQNIDVENEGVILPNPDSNGIMKTTEVDVSIRNNTLHRNAESFTQREATTHAENAIPRPYHS